MKPCGIIDFLHVFFSVELSCEFRIKSELLNKRSETAYIEFYYISITPPVFLNPVSGIIIRFRFFDLAMKYNCRII